MLIWGGFQLLGNALPGQDQVIFFSSFLLLIILQQIDFRNEQLKYYYILTVFCGIVMSLWGVAQCLGIADIYYNDIPSTGSFENPTGIAMFLSAIFPYSIFLLMQNVGWVRICGALAGLLMIILIIMSHSRTGLLALLSVGGLYSCRYICMRKERYVLKKWGYWGGGLSLIVLLFILYFWKKDSADGRMLIWLNSWRMLVDHGFLGAGSGAFSAQYMLYQAEYFRDYPDSIFRLLADNVKHPFNEYLRILVDYGIMGGGILLVWIIHLLKMFKNNWEDNFLLPVFGSLLTIGIAALFSYPLSYPSIMMLLGINVVIIFSRCWQFKILKKQVHVYIFKSVMILLLIPFSLLFSNWIWAEREWYKITHLSCARDIGEIHARYQLVYPRMKHDGLFLYNYGAELFRLDAFEESIKILQESEVYFNDINLQLLLADNYTNLCMYDKAEEHLLLATNMCPVRFVPLYRLFKIYILRKDKRRALQLGKVILEKPIKVNSPVIQYIVQNVKREMDILTSKGVT